MMTSIQPTKAWEEREELRLELAMDGTDEATLLEAGELLTDELTELLTEEWALEAAEEEAMLELRLLDGNATLFRNRKFMLTQYSSLMYKGFIGLTESSSHSCPRLASTK